MSNLEKKLSLDTGISHIRSRSSMSTITFASASLTTLSSPCSEPPLSPLSAISAYSGTPSLPPRPGRELPMPLLRTIRNLDQARAALQLCLDKLKRHFGRLHEADPMSMDAIAVLGEMRRLRPWLEQWEKAFSTYLAIAIPSMAQEDLKKSRVIKANHLCSMVLASTSGVRDVDFECFLSEFRAIVGLAGAILEGTSNPDPTPILMQHARESLSGIPAAMNIADPLRVVVCCCTDRSVKTRAAEYLQQSMPASYRTANA